MELREIEQEAKEQEREADDIGQEVESHKQEVAQLEEVVAELKQAQSDVESDEVGEAIQDADLARQAVEQRMGELRDRRDDLIQKNDEMREHVSASMDRKRRASDKLQLMTRGMRSGSEGARVASGFYGKMEAALSDDLNNTAGTWADLEAARERLDAVDI